ncbi:hypothetical protein N2152v2_004985 [Parachlorella kessleri]
MRSLVLLLLAGDGRSLLQSIYSPSPSPSPSPLPTEVVTGFTYTNTDKPSSTIDAAEYNGGRRRNLLVSAYRQANNEAFRTILALSIATANGVPTSQADSSISSVDSEALTNNELMVLKFTYTFELVVGQELALVNLITSYVNTGILTSLALSKGGASWAAAPLKYLNGGPNNCITGKATPCPPVPNKQNTEPVVLPPTQLGFQIDTYVQNDQSCGVFWQQSEPHGSKPPNAAIRLGMRSTSDEVAEGLGLVKGKNYKVASMSNLCTNAPKGAQGVNAQRKRMRTTVTPKLPAERNADFLISLRAKVDAGVFTHYAQQWGAGIWTPKPFKYLSGASTICAPSQKAYGGSCGGGWKPSAITPL